MCAHLESTVLIASDLVVAITVTIQRSEHNAEGSSPLAEEDEEMMSQRLLREEEAPVLNWKEVTETQRVNEKNKKIKNNGCYKDLASFKGKTIIYREYTG